MMYNLIAYFGVKALIFSTIGLIVLFLMRRSPASTRHAIAVAFLGALIFLPIVGYFGPHLTMKSAEPIARAVHYVTEPRLIVFEQGQSQAVTPVAQEEAYATTDYATTILALTYIIVCGLILLKLSIGLVMAKRFNIGAREFDRGVMLSELISTPMTVWAGRPTIVLPVESMNWEPNRLARVIAHERAHVKRKDLLWNFLGQVVCAFYWIVPTVWILQRFSRDAAERACDDVVLKSGNDATDYAQDLLEIARNASNSMPSLAMPIVNKSEVGNRIAHILDRKVRRGTATLAATLLIGAFALCISLPVAAIGLHYIPQGMDPEMPLRAAKSRAILASSQANPTSWASPGSDAATTDNGFVGMLPDKRKVELLQVQRMNGKTFEAWKPDGNPTTNQTNYGGEKWMTDPNHLVMVVRFQTSNTTDCVGAGLGSGPRYPGDAEIQDFAGGGFLPPSEKGWRTEIAYIGIVKGPMTTSSYTFAVSDEKVKTLATIKLRDGGRIDVTSSQSVSNIAFNPRLEVSIPNRNAKGELVKGKGGVVSHLENRPALTFSALTHPPLDSVVAYAYDKKGTRYMGIGARDGEGQYFNVPLNQLDHFEIVLNRMQAVDMLHVRLSPWSTAKS